MDDLKNFEKAEEYYLKAIETDSTYYNAYLNLGNIYENQKSIKYYSKAIQIDSNNPYGYYNRALNVNRRNV